jgi:hypothetical protein
MLDVIVTLNVTTTAQTQAAADELAHMGLAIVRIDPPNGVIEGTIKADKLASLRRARGVRYVRRRFEYMAAKSPDAAQKTKPGDSPDAAS